MRYPKKQSKPGVTYSETFVKYMPYINRKKEGVAPHVLLTPVERDEIVAAINAQTEALRKIEATGARTAQLSVLGYEINGFRFLLDLHNNF